MKGPIAEDPKLARYPAEAVRKLEGVGMAPRDILELARVRRVLAAIPLRSPRAGFLARKAAVPGSYVTPGTELFQVADLSTVWVVADVPEGDMGRLRPGQPARFTTAALPGATFAGEVQLVYPAVSPETHTLQARVAIANADARLRPGLYGDVVLGLPAAEALVVPAEAVVDTGERKYAFVALPGGRFEPRAVRLGVRAGDSVVVLEGLAEGEQVVTTANFLVDSESRLRVAVESAATPSSETPR